MRHEISLTGCTPTPLASYLKALGVLRLVAEQTDPEVRGYWANERFLLTTTLSDNALIDFFGAYYFPTPILAPWNGGSGFYAGDNTTGLDLLKNSKAERFNAIRASIAFLEQVLARFELTKKPSGKAKTALLEAIRADTDDNFLQWLDAAVLLTERDPKYPPLLGTGGNDGRLDFTNNFMQRLVQLIDPQTGNIQAKSHAYLVQALFGSPTFGMVNKAIGQFMPGSAGGPNASTGFEADSLINPWDFVLMLEGALLFAATATRRQTCISDGELSYPFTVRPTGSGAGSTALSDEAPARAEVWMPLWDRPLSFAELRILLGEGRVNTGRRAARDGLDFARAVAGLGVQRGIIAFQRYAFMMRSGKAYLATPLNRIPVKRNPNAALIDQLERNQFLDRFRRFARSSTASNHVRQLGHRLEDALFDLADGTPEPEQERPKRVQSVIEALGDILLHLANSPKAREACPRLPWLDRGWILAGNDQSPEFRVAAALAGLGTAHLPMLSHILPVDAKRPTTYDEESRRVVWHHGALEHNLSTVLHRRLLEANTMDWEDKPLDGLPPADLEAIAAYLNRDTDDFRIARLLCGLALIARPPHSLPGRAARGSPLPASYRILKPLFAPEAQLRRIGVLAENDNLPLPKAVPALLTAGKTQQALEAGMQRRRASGLAVSFQHVVTHGVDGNRLLAALMIPIHDADLARVIHDTKRSTTESSRQTAN